MGNRFIVFLYIGTVGYLSLKNFKLHNNNVPRRSDRNLLFNLIKFMIITYVVLLPIHLGAMDVNEFTQSVSDYKRCFASNGIPNHEVGIFPNRGNPHSILPQQINVCVQRYPEKLSTYTKIRGIIGIALNGVLFRPGTAGFWGPLRPKKTQSTRGSELERRYFWAEGQIRIGF